MFLSLHIEVVIFSNRLVEFYYSLFISLEFTLHLKKDFSDTSSDLASTL